MNTTYSTQHSSTANPNFDSPLVLARHASALTRTDLAILAGFTSRELSELEHEPTQATIADLARIAQELNADGRAILSTWLQETLGL